MSAQRSLGPPFQSQCKLKQQCLQHTVIFSKVGYFAFPKLRTRASGNLSAALSTQVNNLRRRLKPDFPPSLCKTLAPVRFFAIHKQRLIHKPYLLNGRSPYHETASTYPVSAERSEPANLIGCHRANSFVPYFSYQYPSNFRPECRESCPRLL